MDALEKAFRAALAPVYPELAGVVLTNFRAQIVGGRSGTRAPVRVRITGARPDGASWTTVGCSADLLHAGWLALADCFEFAVLSLGRRAGDAVHEATA